MKTTLLQNTIHQMYNSLIPDAQLIENGTHPKLLIGKCFFKYNVFICKNFLLTWAFRWLYLSKAEISLVITNPEDFLVQEEEEKYETLCDVISISARKFIVLNKKHLRLMFRFSKIIRLTMLAIIIWVAAACIGTYLR